MKEETGVGIVIFIIVWVAYILSSYPSVAGGDSGELLAEACQLGVAHPPGYPSFILLNYAVAKLPLVRPLFNTNSGFQLDFYPTVAWKMTQLSAICGAITSWFIFKSTTLVTAVLNGNFEAKHVSFSGGIVALCYAFMPLVWEYSVSAEVFALNNCICALILYLTLKAIVAICHENPASNSSVGNFMYIYLGAFFCGIAFTNQHTSLIHVSFLILSIMGVLIFRKGFWKSLPVILTAAICCLMGFVPYLHLYISALNPRKGSWGNTSTFWGFFRHVLRAEYGTFRLGFIEGSENAIERTFRYIVFTNEQMSYVPVLFFVLYLLSFIISFTDSSTQKSPSTKPFQSPRSKTRGKKPNKGNFGDSVADSVEEIKDTKSFLRKILLFILFGNFLWYVLIWHGIFSNLPLSNPMAFGVHSRFWMQPNIVASIFLGLMLDRSLHCILRRFGAMSLLTNSFVTLSILVLYSAVILGRNWNIATRSDDLSWTIHQHGENILRNIPNDSVLLSHTDLDLNPVRYLQHCESSYANKSVHHLSLQMMPYPWFSTLQEPLYTHAGIVFPSTQFEGVSTNRLSEGNARLITQFLRANLPPPMPGKLSTFQKAHRAVFLDMQAVNEAEIEAMGSWRGYLLIPFGLEYLVVPSYYFINTTGTNPTLLPTHVVASRYHSLSWEALQRIKGHFPVMSGVFHRKFPRGTWEAAAMNVYYDAHYQSGLFYLTWVLDGQTAISVDTLNVLLDRLLVAVTVLQEAWDAASRYQTFSSSLRDLQRNTAVAYMRLQSMLGVLYKIQAKVQATLIAQLDAAAAHSTSQEENHDTIDSVTSLYDVKDTETSKFLVPHILRDIVSSSPSSDIGQNWMHKIFVSLEQYVHDYPDDENIEVFRASVKSAKALLNST